ncbi:hypothetical protein C2845_PM17G08020 [Panicum miliaceum]|uniref:HIT domain-containing protein n=1 Tax=Panicum miliaceum TaxID=4540 RepID=A0A3L6Q0A9_PANMI|nr:hypothetical protein C2845_PM17G08020 [Panicum miliaceum]
MSPPRRLAVLCSHLRPDGPAPPAGEQLEAAAAGSVSTSTCASGGGAAAGGDGGGNGDSAGCVFCRIISGEAPAYKVYEDDVCLCILDSHPLAPGHSLIIPKHHFPSLEATPPPVVAAMCSKVPFLSNAIMKATECDSFNLVVNNGAAAGQVIFHTHFHIIPRRSGDKLWPTESFRRRSIEPNETSGLVSCIKEQLCSTLEGCKAEASSLLKEP